MADSLVKAAAEGTQNPTPGSAAEKAVSVVSVLFLSAPRLGLLFRSLCPSFSPSSPVLPCPAATASGRERGSSALQTQQQPQTI